LNGPSLPRIANLDQNLVMLVVIYVTHWPLSWGVAGGRKTAARFQMNYPRAAMTKRNSGPRTQLVEW